MWHSWSRLRLCESAYKVRGQAEWDVLYFFGYNPHRCLFVHACMSVCIAGLNNYPHKPAVSLYLADSLALRQRHSQMILLLVPLCVWRDICFWYSDNLNWVRLNHWGDRLKFPPKIPNIIENLIWPIIIKLTDYLQIFGIFKPAGQQSIIFSLLYTDNLWYTITIFTFTHNIQLNICSRSTIVHLLTASAPLTFCCPH